MPIKRVVIVPAILCLSIVIIILISTVLFFALSNDSPPLDSFAKIVKKIGETECSGSSATGYNKTCVQCIGGKFEDFKWLMHHGDAFQRVTWDYDWMGTDCLTGVVNRVSCPSSCVTSFIRKEGEKKAQGVVMDCARNFLQNSLDIPPDYRYVDPAHRFMDNGTYYNTRSGYEITTIFCSSPKISMLQIAKGLQDAVVQIEVENQKTVMDSLREHYILICLLVICAVPIFFIIVFCYLKHQKKHPVNHTRRSNYTIRYDAGAENVSIN